MKLHKTMAALAAAVLALGLAGCGGAKPVGSGTNNGGVAGQKTDDVGVKLQDPRVRQAIAYAIDMDAIVKGPMKGKAKVANALMPAGKYKPTDGLTDYKYDPEKAKALLKEAGWDSSVELNLVYYYGDQATVDIMAAIQQYLAQVGIKVKPQKLEGDLAAQLWKKPADPIKGPSAVKWDLAYGAIAALSPHEYYNRFLAGYSSNSYWPENKEYQGLLESANKTVKLEDSYQAFHKIVKWENTNLPEVPLYYQPIFVLASDKVDRKGAEFGNEQYNYDWQINKWDIPSQAAGNKILHTNGGPKEFFETPFLNPGLSMTTRVLWDHLLVANGDLSLKGDQLAAKHEVSEDGKTWTFTLRDGIKWHDGEPITGADVKGTFELAGKVASLNAVFASTLQKLEGYQEFKAGTAKEISGISVNGQQVTFKFAEVDADAALTFSQLPPLPMKYLQDADPLKIQQNPYFQKPVGSGPFKLKDVKMGDYATFEAWDGYWNGRPVIDQIQMYPSGESDPNLVKNVEAGKVDYAFTKAIDDAIAVEKVPGMKVNDVDVFYTRLLYINSFPRK